MRKAAGFTLIELIVTLTVAGILVSIAIPDFKTTIDNNRQISELNTLLSGMVYARSEAVKRNVDVVICSTSDQKTCSGTWSNGWLVYYTPTGTYDAPGTTNPTNPLPAPTSSEIIREYPALGGGNSLKSDSNAVNNTVVFQPSGLTLLANDSQFTLCDSRGSQYGRVLMVSVTGRAEGLPWNNGSGPVWGSKTLTVTCP